MVRRVEITSWAAKQLRKVPSQVRDKLWLWATAVELRGLESVRRVRGYRDEPLKGKRTGQRSIRLSRGYRAIYVIVRDGIEFVSIEEVTKHDY